MNSYFTYRRLSPIGVLFVLWSPLLVIAEPAVNEPNVKLSAQGGSFDGKGTGIGFGSFAVPLSESFGLQVDAGAGSIDSSAYWGTGTHLFWRDPTIGLLGLTYSYQMWHDVDSSFRNSAQDAYMHRGGVEGELYLSRFTLGARGGYQDGTLNGDGYGQLKFRYYATDDLALQVKGDHFGGLNLIRGSFEYRPDIKALPGLSVFAEGGYGTRDFGMGQAGIRYYFGSTTRLIERDRRSDPDSLITDDTNPFIHRVLDGRRDSPAPVAPIKPPPPLHF